MDVMLGPCEGHQGMKRERVVTAEKLPSVGEERPLANFCRRWKIAELSLFGSALRDDFALDSNLDFLVSFAPDATWSLFDHVDMEEELTALLGRPADLMERSAVERSENWIRREDILGSAQMIYAIAIGTRRRAMDNTESQGY
jgi:hypothetical protein